MNYFETSGECATKLGMVCLECGILFTSSKIALIGKASLQPALRFHSFVPMKFPIKFDTVKSGLSIMKIEGSQKKLYRIISLKIDFV